MHAELGQCLNQACLKQYRVVAMTDGFGASWLKPGQIVCPYCGFARKGKPQFLYMTKPLNSDRLVPPGKHGTKRREIQAWGWKP